MLCLLIILNIGFYLFVGCAFDLANIKPTPTEIVHCKNDCVSFIISKDVYLENISCGYSRTIKKGSEWIHTGDIPQGHVYKPVNTCFTIECSNVFEGYLVIVDKSIVGFYLPVEKGYVPIKKPVTIITQ